MVSRSSVEIHLLGRRHLDVEHIAAERLDLHLVLQQLAAHAFGLGVGLVDLVDRDDHRDLGGLGVIDRLDRLRHDAVVGRDHQNDEIGHLRAACPHRGECRVAGRVDEGDLAALRRRHLIGADVLGDAARFAAHHIGLPDRIEQRRLAVVDMAHDGHDRRPRHERRRIVGGVEQAFFHIRLGDAAHRVAELLGEQLRGIGIDGVGDLRHVTLLHQDLDDVDRAFRHAVREFLDGDGFRDGDFAHELFLLLAVAMTGHALRAPAERGDGAFAHFVGIERGRQREAAALLRGAGARRLRSGCGTRQSAADAAPRRAAVVVFGFGGQLARDRAEAGLGFFFLAAETLLGDFVGLALGLFVVAAAVFLGALARLGGLALGALDRVALLADFRLFLGDLAFFGLAHLRVAERIRAAVLLFLGERAQKDAGRLRRGGRGRGRRRGRRRGGRCAARNHADTARGRAAIRRGGGRKLGRLGVAPDAALHLLDHDRLGAAVTEALPHHAGFGTRLECQCLGRADAERLVAGGFRIGRHTVFVPIRFRALVSRVS